MRRKRNMPAAASVSPKEPGNGDITGAIASATEYLIASRQAERALTAGTSAPTFRLKDHRGVGVASGKLLGHGPLLLTFYTGLWSPACNHDLRAFEVLRPSVEARGASLVSISQQTVAENAKVHAQLKLGFPILSDRGGRISQLYGVRWCIPEILRDIHRRNGIDLPLLNGEASWTLPIPARFILDRDGIIAYSEINPGQSGRSPPRDVLPVLDHLCSPRSA